MANEVYVELTRTIYNQDMDEKIVIVEDPDGLGMVHVEVYDGFNTDKPYADFNMSIKTAIQVAKSIGSCVSELEIKEKGNASGS